MGAYVCVCNKEDWQGVSASKDAIAYLLLIINYHPHEHFDKS